MNRDHLKKQMETAQEALSKMKETMSLFDESMSLAIIDAPESEKKNIEKIRSSCRKVINAAKEGDTDEVNNLISELRNKWGSK